MSDLTTLLPLELADIGLVAAADPNFCERLLAALDRLPAAEAPARSAKASAQNALDPAA